MYQSFLTCFEKQYFIPEKANLSVLSMELGLVSKVWNQGWNSEFDHWYFCFVSDLVKNTQSARK